MRPDEQLAMLADLRARAWAVACAGRDLRRDTQQALADAQALREELYTTLHAWRVAKGRQEDRLEWPGPAGLPSPHN